MQSYLKVYPFEDPDVYRTAAKLGAVASLMSLSKTHRQYSITHLIGIASEAIRNGNLKIYHNVDGVPVAYVVWAHLMPQSVPKLLRNGPPSLHPSEWNEGTEAWIVDFVAPSGHIKYILADLRDNVFSHCTRLKYFRIKNNIRIYKEISRSSRSFFWRRDSDRTVNTCPCGDPQCEYSVS
jgi:hemolysin-activating ACP:hemolysin acyltransferase